MPPAEPQHLLAPIVFIPPCGEAIGELVIISTCGLEVSVFVFGVALISLPLVLIGVIFPFSPIKTIPLIVLFFSTLFRFASVGSANAWVEKAKARPRMNRKTEVLFLAIFDILMIPHFTVVTSSFIARDHITSLHSSALFTLCCN